MTAVQAGAHEEDSCKRSLVTVQPLSVGPRGPHVCARVLIYPQCTEGGSTGRGVIGTVLTRYPGERGIKSVGTCSVTKFPNRCGSCVGFISALLDNSVLISPYLWYCKCASIAGLQYVQLLKRCHH